MNFAGLVKGFSMDFSNVFDILIYVATAAVAIVGLVKCVAPVRRNARSLRRGIRRMEDNMRDAVWRETQFLGKTLSPAWRRFLTNAEQLDAHGLTCGVDDYINDDTVIHSVGHAQLAEIIPSLLTSLGILGTFIGLVRGLGGLDVSDAAKTMESIPQMIGGMTYAFTTSLVGVTCSLIFNILHKAAVGSAEKAIDEFNDAFEELVMPQPLDDSVKMICQQEDQTVILRRMSGDMAGRVSEGIVSSVEQSLRPVAQSMSQFILGQTQTQIDGLNRIVQQFMQQMNGALSNQFAQLGQTLSMVNQSQTVSSEALQRTMSSAEIILGGMQQVQDTTEKVMRRFESYVQTLESAQQENGNFVNYGSQVLSGMMSAADEQRTYLNNIRDVQSELKKNMNDYAEWSARVLSAVEKQTGTALNVSGDVASRLDRSTREFGESYADFVDKLTNGFTRTMTRFEENVSGVTRQLSQQMTEYAKATQSVSGEEVQSCIAAVSRLQRTVSDLNRLLEDRTEGK